LSHYSTRWTALPVSLHFRVGGKYQQEYREFIIKENNNLEFIASMISVWLTILTSHDEEFPCFLALGGNMSAMSWLHKANVDKNENKPLHLPTRKYAEVLMGNNCCLYSQHIQGVKNKVADALSRLHHLSPLCMHNYIIKHLFHLLFILYLSHLKYLMTDEDQRYEGVGEGTKKQGNEGLEMMV